MTLKIRINEIYDRVNKDGLLDRKSFLELTGADHLCWLYPFVELGLSKVAELEG